MTDAEDNAQAREFMQREAAREPTKAFRAAFFKGATAAREGQPQGSNPYGLPALGHHGKGWFPAFARAWSRGWTSYRRAFGES